MFGYIADKPEDLKLLLFVDADFAGDSDSAKSTSGGLLVLAGPNSWYPLAWMCRKQTSVSRSTTESEVVSLAASLFAEALPIQTMFDMLLGRDIELVVLEDNQATIRVVMSGFSAKLRHISRTHEVNLGSMTDVFKPGGRLSKTNKLEYCPTDLQAADIFTKL